MSLEQYAGKRVFSHCCFCEELYHEDIVPIGGMDDMMKQSIAHANFEHMKVCEKHPYGQLRAHYLDLITYLRAGIDLHEQQLEGPMSKYPVDLPKAIQLRDDVAGRLDTKG